MAEITHGRLFDLTLCGLVLKKELHLESHESNKLISEKALINVSNLTFSDRTSGIRKLNSVEYIRKIRSIAQLSGPENQLTP